MACLISFRTFALVRSSVIKPCQFRLDRAFNSRDACSKSWFIPLPWHTSYYRQVHQNRGRTTKVQDDDTFNEDVVQTPPFPTDRQGPSDDKIRLKFKKKAIMTSDALGLVDKLTQTYPQLVEFNDVDVVTYLERLSSYNIDVDNAVQMLLISPNVLEISDAKIQACLQGLRNIGFTEKQRKSAIRRVPALLQIPSKKIGRQYSFLKLYFTAEETLDIMSKSLEVFLEAETSLKRKLEYLIKEVSHETKNIVTCKALTYPLSHMKTRHEFLIRSGYFKPIPYNRLIKVLEKDYKDKNKQRDKYFKPLEVVCYSDADFLKVCTKGMISLNEYVAFEELYRAELEVQSDQEEMRIDIHGNIVDEEEDLWESDDDSDNAVSLVNETNSAGFLNDGESNSCYF